MIAAGTAVAATVSGAGVLYAAWRKRFAGKTFALWGGWVLLLLAMFAWTRATGAEFGVVLGLTAPAMAAWLFVLAGAMRRRPYRAHGRIRETPPAPVSSRRWLHHVLLLVLAAPLAAASATLLALALSALLPWSELNRTVAAVFLMPVLWGAAAAWVCGDRKTGRPVAALVLAGGLSALALFAGGAA